MRMFARNLRAAVTGMPRQVQFVLFLLAALPAIPFWAVMWLLLESTIQLGDLFSVIADADLDERVYVDLTRAAVGNGRLSSAYELMLWATFGTTTFGAVFLLIAAPLGRKDKASGHGEEA